MRTCRVYRELKAVLENVTDEMALKGLMPLVATPYLMHAGRSHKVGALLPPHHGQGLGLLSPRGRQVVVA